MCCTAMANLWLWEVERKPLIKPNYDFIGLGNPFVTVGEIIFDTQIPEKSFISLEYNMYLVVKQLEGQKVIKYSKELITIRWNV